MTIVFACVTDGSPKYDYQALVWATTLVRCAEQSPEHIIVHATGGKGQLLRRVEQLGIEVAPIEPFDPTWPRAHKIAQLDSPALHSIGADYAVLCDCDLAFCSDPSQWVGGRFRAKLVDRARPPIEIWRRLFELEEFPEPPEESLPTNASTPTYARNVNAGVLIVSMSLLEDLKPAWAHWYRRTLRHRRLLGKHAVHVVQVSLALALRQLNATVDHLPLALNFPAHLPLEDLPLADVDPVILHFHHRVDAAGLLIPVGFPRVDAAIRRVNSVLEQETSPFYPGEAAGRTTLEVVWKAVKRLDMRARL